MIGDLAVLMLVGAQADPPPVPNPHIPCWSGARTWSPEGEPPSRFVFFGPEGEEPAPLIRHHREMIFEGEETVQSYNFITYDFANGDDPLTARAYLDEIDSVSILLLNPPASATVAEARPRIGAGVLCYLQKRYRMIDVLVDTGYERLWPIE